MGNQDSTSKRTLLVPSKKKSANKESDGCKERGNFLVHAIIIGVWAITLGPTIFYFLIFLLQLLKHCEEEDQATHRASDYNGTIHISVTILFSRISCLELKRNLICLRGEGGSGKMLVKLLARLL